MEDALGRPQSSSGSAGLETSWRGTARKDVPYRNEKSDEGEAALAKVSAEKRRRIGPEPAVDDPRVDGSEVGFDVDVAGGVFERRILRIRRQIGRRAVEPAAHAAAHRHHHRRGAVIGPLTA